MHEIRLDEHNAPCHTPGSEYPSNLTPCTVASFVAGHMPSDYD